MFNLLSYKILDYALNKNARYLSVNVFSLKVLIKVGTLVGTGPPFYVVI